MISCQQSQPSTTQVQKPTNATETKYVYPPESISNYVDVCTKGGGTKKACDCFISKAQDIYPLDKLIQINNDSSAGKPNPKDIDGILKSCQEGVKQEDRSKEILDIAKQVELSVITREDAIKQLKVLANQENTTIENRSVADEQILALIKDRNKEEVALNKQKQISFEQLAANGYITELESLDKISELKKRNLEINAENIRAANAYIAAKRIRDRR
jgi:hypothetical protein